LEEEFNIEFPSGFLEDNIFDQYQEGLVERIMESIKGALE
jgi:hypothetical protein